MVNFSLNDDDKNIVLIRSVLPRQDESFLITTGVMKVSDYILFMRNDVTHRSEAYFHLILSGLMIERFYVASVTGIHVVEGRGQSPTTYPTRVGFTVLPAIEAKYIARMNLREDFSALLDLMPPSMAKEIMELELIDESRGFILINFQENRIIHVVPPDLDERQSMRGEAFGTFSWNAQTVCLAMNSQIAIMDNPF